MSKLWCFTIAYLYARCNYMNPFKGIQKRCASMAGAQSDGQAWSASLGLLASRRMSITPPSATTRGINSQ